MRRLIVDYKKLTPELLELLTQKFPDGYGDNDIIIFDNHKNETIEAVEVKTKDSIYLVKVSSKLHYTMNNFDINEDLLLDDAGHIVIEEEE
ncbi:hypothetical protein Q4512_07680 [Oceanihabitans sp. 2_MG-2023]|uniref:hypothetical protein n=1 Tax=Oceanihabitans sp. 2_MG-2023 TaxID=3062661 RepID=UPI0026E399E6|nr:hypothetical protein [Oceanihabitans sp. 2_MG-2023]MDO6596792.1 hypothetical protein [Oceanihabitans sp. 2_MG-2023]